MITRHTAIGWIVCICAVCSLSACRQLSLFTPQTPRAQYEARLRKEGLDKTPAGAQWLRAAAVAMRHPAWISPQHTERGRFHDSLHGASVLLFRTEEGRRISIRLISDNTSGSRAMFLELYAADTVVPASSRLLRTGDSVLTYDADATGAYFVLLQPQMGSFASYRLSVAAGPSLSYPVVNPAKNRIGSVWGDDRDAGARRHEGVDIFAPKGTPAVAAASGRVTRVANGGLGGKTVWIAPDDRAYSLYYAHLDSQWVQAGDVVRSGDTVGQVGNTGNARNTAAHLHFGIYGRNGAVNPAPFIAPAAGTSDFSSMKTLIEQSRRTTVKTKMLQYPSTSGTVLRTLPAATSLFVEASSGKYYRVRLPDTSRGWILSTTVMAAE